MRSAALALIGVVTVAGVVIVVWALLDLGPFGDDEQSLSEQQFLTRADRICAEAHSSFRQAQRKPPLTVIQAEAQTETLISTAEHELADVEALQAPSSLSQPLSRYLAARERGIDLLRRGLDAARNNNGTAYAAAQAKLASGQPARERLARRVGFRQCSEPITSRAELERDASPEVVPG